MDLNNLFLFFILITFLPFFYKWLLPNIEKYKPYLFFEFMSENYDGYKLLLDKLNTLGYEEWTMLNNYGDIIMENKKFEEAKKILNISHKNKKYIDIFCKIKK